MNKKRKAKKSKGLGSSGVKFGYNLYHDENPVSRIMGTKGIGINMKSMPQKKISK